MLIDQDLGDQRDGVAVQSALGEIVLEDALNMQPTAPWISAAA